MKKVIVIGSGFAGLSAAATLGQQGYQVTVIEKNTEIGGRARQFEVDGFKFDMGPSWYWMPEVFEDFYNKFGFKTSDFYQLERLEPSYRVYFDEGDFIDLPSDYDDLKALFDSMEPGSGAKLDAFLDEAKYKYEVGMNEFVWKPSLSILEFMDVRIAKSAMKLQMFSSLSSQVRKLFTHPRIIKILEFPVLFLGSTPSKIPALYSLMNYADIKLGTWYPIGGMHQTIKAFAHICMSVGVEFITGEEVLSLETERVNITKVKTTSNTYECDAVINTADYHHFETEVLSPSFQSYSKNYWDKRIMAPSSLLYYLGLDTKLEGIKHHALFFDEDFDKHAAEIYTDPKWPTAPLFYACTPSVTDDSVAPEGSENMFLLMPLAPDIEDNESLREEYFNVMLDRLNKVAGFDIKDHIVYKRSFCVNDFKSEYNSFKGNAYGLANTLEQTAFLKPKMKSRKLRNLFHAGQLTNPGPGVPPSIISGQVAATLTQKQLK